MSDLFLDVGKVTIEPFEFEEIIKVNIEKELNEHSIMYVYGIIKDEKEVEPVMSSAEGVTVKYVHDGKEYFNGVLQNIKITCVNDVFHLEVYAISHTIKLDTVKHIRSFQDKAQTYEDIVKEVIADAGATVTYNADSTNVENIILQYNETDWQFAKRLASHTNDVLIPIIDDTPKFHFGATDDGDVDVETKGYAVSRDFNAVRRMSKEEKVLTADDATVHTIATNEFIGDLGEKITLNGSPLHICRLSLSLEESVLTVFYTLVVKNAISTPKFYNKAITGLVLDGKVVEVENDTLKLDLAAGSKRGKQEVAGVEKDTGERHFFKYATGYSMEKHTGWYVMPEEDDIVQLIFPIEDEKYAYAASSIRQEDTDRTTDHMIKYWRTSYGKEIKFDKNEILVSALDDTTFIRINEDEKKGIIITTPHPVLIHSGSTLTMTSDDDMTITTEKNLYIEAQDSIKMVCKGNVMDFIPASGISMTTDKELNTSSDKVTSMTAKKDMKLHSDTKLLESAQTQIDLNGMGSSITMKSSGIDLKGALIKEN